MDTSQQAFALMAQPVTERELTAVRPNLDEVFQRHAAFVYRVLRRLDVPAADLDDALQEVFMVVARKLESYQEQAAVKAWLFGIARQVAMHVKRSHRRSEGRKLRVAQLGAETAVGGGPEEQLAQHQQAARAQALLERLGPDHAMVFYLAEVEGFTAPEIAAALQIKLNTVYSRLRVSRARIEEWVRRAPGRHAGKSSREPSKGRQR